MTPQQKVNELARRLVHEVFYGTLASDLPKAVGEYARELDAALGKMDCPLVAPPVEARIGCWLTRDGSKAVVKRIVSAEREYPFKGFVEGKGLEPWRNSSWNRDGMWMPRTDHPKTLLTFISPDVEYWEKEGKPKPDTESEFKGPRGWARVHPMEPEPKFDPSQLTVIFVVRFPEEPFESDVELFPLGLSKKGLTVLDARIPRGFQFYNWDQLKNKNALWSTDRKTWREFK